MNNKEWYMYFWGAFFGSFIMASGSSELHFRISFPIFMLIMAIVFLVIEIKESNKK